METLLTIGLGNAVLACLLGVAAGAASLFGRRPALAHGLWLLVLLKLVTPPLVHFNMPQLVTVSSESPARVPELPPTPEPLPPIILVEPEDVPALDVPVGETDLALPLDEKPQAGAAPIPPAAAEDFSWTFLPAVTVAVWAAGSIGWLALTVVRVQRFRRLLRHATPAPAALVSEVADLSRRLGVGRPPDVLLVPGPVSPMVWGLFGSPRLLVPAELLGRLDGEQLTTLLAHELAHLRRRDHWVRLLELLATGLYWWHPVVWLARRSLREAEEECCDAWVVWLLPDSAKSYAGALLETVIFLTDAVAVPPVASGVGPFPVLKRRLTMIMRGTRPRSLSAVGLLGVLGLGAALLPWAPSWAQDPTDPARPAAGRDAIRVELQPNKDVKPEEIDKAAQELKKATEELERARLRLREAEKRWADAHTRLAELGGGDGRVIIRDAGDGRTRVLIRGEFPPPPAGVVRVEGARTDPKAAEQLAVLTAERKAKEAEAREAAIRLEEARRRLEVVRQLLDRKAVTSDEVDAATAQVKIMEAQLQAKKAELEAVTARLDAAKLRSAEAGHQAGGVPGDARILLQRLQPPMPPATVAAPPSTDGERRLQNLERQLAELLREVQGMRQEMNRPSTRPVAPVTPPAPRP